MNIVCYSKKIRLYVIYKNNNLNTGFGMSVIRSNIPILENC